MDPVWQWEWEEGAAAAIATFRTAADLVEEYDTFVFNHNEVILYEWVEEYEPKLFKRIQRLVKEGRWHIMGGWYLQPDCNMPSGESFVRQALVGREYFRRKFGVVPRTAINLDPFGHTRGLAQILAKSGYDSYLFCRPFQDDCALPSDDFTWVGFDGSEILCHRSSTFYNAPLGKADEKVKEWMANNADKEAGLVLWGVGDHGGGPSRRDIEQLGELKKATEDRKIVHSSPEAYFNDIRRSGTPLPLFERDINPWGVGCYTSQVRIKQKHRLLENEIFMLEKMASHSALAELMKYPKKEIRAALRDLLYAEFHDILPGSSIQPVEDAALRLLDHGLEITSRAKARAFFALAAPEPPCKPDEYPILVYNPHPFPVEGVWECEFQLEDINWEETFSVPTVYRDGKPLPTQNEKELGNLSIDWRKRPVFRATLEPASMNRFDCKVEVLPERPKPDLAPKDGKIEFQTDRLDIVINTETGLIDRYKVDGVEYLKPGAFALLMIDDYDDPWGMQRKEYRDVIGRFEVMSPEEGTRFSGVTEGTLDSVRVVEDGDVRTVVECILECADSFAVVTYKLPKQGTEVEIHVRVHWNEKSKMLKLAVPTVFAQAKYLGQVAYGVDELDPSGREVVSQKWQAVVSESDEKAFTCIDDGIYGSDFLDGEMRLNLLRSPAYCGHPFMERPIVRQDRYTPRIDQGERQYRFWFNAGTQVERLAHVDREALVHNEKPFAVSFNPPGIGEKPEPLAILSDDVIQLAAFKRSEKGRRYVIRLFNPTDEERSTTLSLPILGVEEDVTLGGFEIKTLAIGAKKKKLREIDLMEGLAKAVE
jgi:alpha-mannosidase